MTVGIRECMLRICVDTITAIVLAHCKEKPMLNMSNPSTFRRSVVGLSLIAAPLFGLIGASVLPKYTGGMEGELAFIAAHPTRWLVGLYVDLLTMIPMIVAIFGLLHLLRRRAVILGHISGGLMLVGSFFHGAVLGFQFVEAPLVVSGINHTQIVAFSEQMYNHTAFTLLLMPFLCFYLGLLLMAVALWRARIGSPWVSGIIVVSIAFEFFGPPALHTQLYFGLFLLAFGWIGFQVLRMSDTQWEHDVAEVFDEHMVVGQPTW